MAIPLVAMAGAQAAIGVVGGLMGQAAASGDQQAAREAADQSFRYLSRIGMPPSEARDIVYQQYAQQGVYNPELEKAIEEAHSKFADIKRDDELRQTQLEALEDVKRQARLGASPADLAAAKKLKSQLGQESQAKMESILQGAQARGMGGSGAELAAQLSESQAGANREAQAAEDLAAKLFARSQGAQELKSKLAGQLRQEDFTEEGLKAQAEDQFTRFNKAAQIERQQRNVNRENEAQAANLAAKQRVADINTQLANQEIQRKAYAPINDWQRQAGWLQGMATGSMNQANYLQGQADRTANKYAGMTSAISGGVAGIGSALGQQQALDAYNTRTAAMTPKPSSSELIQAGQSSAYPFLNPISKRSLGL